MTEFEKLIKLTPNGDNGIDFDGIEQSFLKPYISRMNTTEQNPKWHGEGDVWAHTRAVLSALASDVEYQKQSLRKRQILFVAALLHDVGKIFCSTVEDGVIKSHNHSSVGARTAREILWCGAGLCGTKEKQAFREAVVALVRHHGLSMHFFDRDDQEQRLIGVAAMGELLPDFSLEMLWILSRADILGRIADDTEILLENAALCFELAQEQGVLTKPYPFPSAVTKHAYLAGRSIPRDFALYDETWKEVILLSGVPGTGKDTWIKENCPGLPVISLDDIRAELGISPTDSEGQGLVINTAKERAKELLRKKQAFVWNATNVTKQIRGKQLSLFEKYGAYTRIVYLETSLEEQFARNSGRKNAVPEAVINKLIAKTEPPTAEEAFEVEWITV